MILWPEITGLNPNSDTVSFNKLPDNHYLHFFISKICSNYNIILVLIKGTDTSHRMPLNVVGAKVGVHKWWLLLLFFIVIIIKSFINIIGKM